jgi:type II secretory pathway pseudopilin PulG
MEFAHLFTSKTPGQTSGFSLIEWLAAMGVVAALLTILPGYTLLKDDAKEAEVKQNLHSIQLALERYSTDNLGLYPFFLYGGDAFCNVGTAAALAGKAVVPSSSPRANPFDTFWPKEYKKHGQFGNPTAAFGDSLIFEGYLTSYPKNPFLSQRLATKFSKSGLLPDNRTHISFAGCGGMDGDAMFNVGWLGEFPAVNVCRKEGDSNRTYLDFPGQFYYHPRFADGGTVTEHNAAQSSSRKTDGFIPPGATVQRDYELIATDVCAYDLIALGDPADEGMDVDWSVLWAGVGGGERHAFREGYLVNGEERNSFNRLGDYRARTSGDGYGDYYIIILYTRIT